MGISDWSSDVCSSDLIAHPGACESLRFGDQDIELGGRQAEPRHPGVQMHGGGRGAGLSASAGPGDRQGVVEGKSVSVSVDLGGRRRIKKEIDNTCTR